MYENYYGFSGSPFQLMPDARFFYESRAHGRAIAHLTFGLSQGEGFVIVTGEVGAGKTTLVERLWSQLDRDTYTLAQVNTTQLSGDDLFRMAMAGFGVEHRGRDKAAMLLDFKSVLHQHQLSRRRCLLVVDEAQNLSLPAIEELRMLSNITEDGRVSLQTLLLGQPQFRRMLASPDLSQLRQRVLASYHLGPLGETETRAYVEHRLATVGWAGHPHIDDAAFTVIHEHSDGIPRRINRLCGRVLLLGALEGAGRITAAMVEDTAVELNQDLEGVPQSFARSGPPMHASLTPAFNLRREQAEMVVDRMQWRDALQERIASLEAKLAAPPPPPVTVPPIVPIVMPGGAAPAPSAPASPVEAEPEPEPEPGPEPEPVAEPVAAAIEVLPDVLPEPDVLPQSHVMPELEEEAEAEAEVLTLAAPAAETEPDPAPPPPPPAAPRPVTSIPAAITPVSIPLLRPAPQNAMTVDVEDWFQVQAYAGVISRDAWESLPRRVEANTDRMLALFDRAGVQGTFFTLGWVAERHPALVRRIVAGGHELASHGYGHALVSDLDEAAFRADVGRARRLLEDIGGVAVRGYRAPTFSMGPRTPWAWDVLAQEGHVYSSSVYPVKHDLYGEPDAQRLPHRRGALWEVPMTTLIWNGRNLPASGGGWFRLAPYALSRQALRKVNQAGERGLFYTHPWEIDPDQPPVPEAKFLSRVRHRVNLAATEGRLAQLLADFSWGRMDQTFAELRPGAMLTAG